MITLTNFKRKYEKLGYANKDKDEISKLRSGLKNEAGRKTLTSEGNRSKLRAMLGDAQESSKVEPSLNTRLRRYKIQKNRTPLPKLEIPKIEVEAPKVSVPKSTAIVKVNKVVSSNKPKLSGKKLALGTLGIAGLGLAAAGINKLRKARADKGKKRGNYK